MALFYRSAWAFSRPGSFSTSIKNKSWICGPCRRAKSFGPSRFVQTSASPNRKPYYVTTPIFYVNAEPHVGHLYTILLADILKRWQVLRGNTDAKLLTGTDEHGMKVQQAAAEQGVTPGELCDRNCKTFQALAREANVSYDHFIRTSDPLHKDTVRHVWAMLDKAGYIYTSEHEGWYCISEEAFYPKSGVQMARDPATGRKIMTTIETGKEVEWSSETNYHFKLSAFKDRLLEFYRANPDFIHPQLYMKNVVDEVSAGLQDLSISRPASRLSWGIPVPGDETQTIYVWLDALLNYLTYAGYPCAPGQEETFMWPADVQVIGKDIVRFHCIYWPAFLMALDLPPPRQILAHAHWTINHQKMSKSTGNTVSPTFAMERFGVDTVRSFLATEGGFEKDADYENSYIVRHYLGNLQRGLGNLTSRLMRSKKWSVRNAVIRAAEDKPYEGNSFGREHEEFLSATARQAKDHMDQLQVMDAMGAVLEITRKTDKYFQESHPWNILSERQPPLPSDYDRLSHVIYNIAESLRISGILLQPFMPGKASTLLDMLGVAADKRTLQFAKYGSDGDYGESDTKQGKGVEGTLFPPLPCKD